MVYENCDRKILVCGSCLMNRYSIVTIALRLYSHYVVDMILAYVELMVAFCLVLGSQLLRARVLCNAIYDD